MGIVKGVTTVVYGPQGCGKTTHAEALAEFLGCARVIDGLQFSGASLTPGALHLTSVTPAEMSPEVFARARVLSFGQVMTLQALTCGGAGALSMSAEKPWRKPPPPPEQAGRVSHL